MRLTCLVGEVLASLEVECKSMPHETGHVKAQPLLEANTERQW